MGRWQRPSRKTNIIVSSASRQSAVSALWYIANEQGMPAFGTQRAFYAPGVKNPWWISSISGRAAGCCVGAITVRVRNLAAMPVMS